MTDEEMDAQAALGTLQDADYESRVRYLARYFLKDVQPIFHPGMTIAELDGWTRTEWEALAGRFIGEMHKAIEIYHRVSQPWNGDRCRFVINQCGGSYNDFSLAGGLYDSTTERLLDGLLEAMQVPRLILDLLARYSHLSDLLPEHIHIEV